MAGWPGAEAGGSSRRWFRQTGGNFALVDFFEGDVDEAHAGVDLDERAARSVQLADAAGDKIDEDFVVSDCLASFIEEQGIHEIY
jgi:hypothetical protein